MPSRCCSPPLSPLFHFLRNRMLWIRHQRWVKGCNGFFGSPYRIFLNRATYTQTTNSLWDVHFDKPPTDGWLPPLTVFLFCAKNPPWSIRSSHDHNTLPICSNLVLYLQFCFHDLWEIILWTCTIDSHFYFGLFRNILLYFDHWINLLLCFLYTWQISWSTWN